MNRSVLAATAVAIALSIGHARAAEILWIQGSWVNLRAEAAANSTIVDRLIVNTEVALLSKQGNWCEVTAKTPEVRGFVACALLGTQAVSLAEVGSPTMAEDKANPHYSAQRSFWLAPSMRRLLEAGENFWSAMLTQEQQEKERPGWFSVAYSGNQPAPVRYAIPEFEAMKNVMKVGIVAAPERRPMLTRWSELKQRVDASVDVQYASIQLSGGQWVPDEVASMVRIARLNPARPSFFKHQGELAPAVSDVEALSAQFGIVERLKVLSGPKWVHPRHNDPFVEGSWDVGSFEVTLDKPVLEYAIGRRGLAELREAVISWKFDVNAEESCSEGFNLKPRAMARSLSGYPRVKHPLAWLHVAEPIPFKKVQITTAARKLVTQPNEQHGRNAFTTIFMHDVDVEGDGVPDLAVWEGMLREGSGGDMLGVRVVFANIGGEWFLLDSDYFAECS
ncbi:MAG: SH3 domain-containing protein [Hydrogenophaga sp.]|uniref:SH3 domain-containing protein n=1 Tax=Hydrogenophaga sp. TaxID=1904254 RepID=UPI00271FE531|nr:SH3 domain-containing protein [Hydrogenophaga sp.]MDO9568328.1 SH3 domain-containing protein [Hydrogenophaga sp.]MDP3374251.1 SH3 domain-containing protein [Hydrogenophaga sp.]